MGDGLAPIAPMVIATHEDTLQSLAQCLQEALQLWSQPVPYQVQAVLKQRNLMVLAQHPPGDAPSSQKVFSKLEAALRSLIPEFANAVFGSSTIPEDTLVTLYVRALGQRHPYASHRFRLTVGREDGEPASRHRRPKIGAAAMPKTASEESSGSHLGDRDPDLTPDPTADDGVLAITRYFPMESVETEPTEAEARSLSWQWIAAGIGVSLVSFTAGLFFMSRPCMAGFCEPLEAAQTLTQKSTQRLQGAQSAQDLQQAEQQLTEANRLLASVAPLAKQHEAAVALLQANQAQAIALEQVLAIERKADQITQTPVGTQSIDDWKATQVSWQQAIAQLSAIPSASPLYPFAQRRLAVYQTNLTAVNQAIATEQQAQKTLKTAKDTFKVAQTRQGVAQSLDSLQLVQATWQVAVNLLHQIPPNTTSAAEAQQLLTTYEPQLIAARDRATQEQLAQKAYAQALVLAQKAQGLERVNQWAQAVIVWREALTYIAQVPNGTNAFNPAQALTPTYTNALAAAESQEQAIAAQQTIQADLNRICSGTPTICSYAIAPDVIRIKFTSTYEQALRNAFATGQAGNYSVLGGAVNHVDSLQASLQTLSNNAGVPLEVYHSNGTELIGSFNPGG